jgi:phage tail sheath protein FI
MPNYFDNSGYPKAQYAPYLPTTQSGSFGNATGQVMAGANFYNAIASTNTQGLVAINYTNSINLMTNQDAYKFNVLAVPGLYYSAYSSTLTTIINNTQNRGDNILVTDLVAYGQSVASVTSQEGNLNTSYAATYWPWVKTIDPDTANQVWVPASTMIPGVYAFNDSIAHPWYAPAGISRGVITNAIQAERVLTQGNRDTLYQANINPIATYPTNGVVVFGQKTLAKKKSALDRINVRRLLIELKSYISQVADNFVFEQNDAVTRNSFLAVINPYLSSIQQQQGLTSFKVIMDETNNPPNVVDNNQLVGQIYLQPTRTAEFILLDFNILPTGAII